MKSIASLAPLAMLLIASGTPAESTAPSADAPMPALTVTVAMPQQGRWARTLAADGTLFPWQEGVIAAETGGLRVTEVLADVGDQVKKGQPLARLARETVEAEIEQRRANVAQARATLEQARSDATRARGVKGKGTLSEQQSGQYLVGEESAKAAVAAAEAALKSSEIRLAQTVVPAVDDGVIVSRSVALGAVVQAGTELFRMVRQGRIEWRGELTAEQLAPVRAGQSVQLQLPGGSKVEGKVRILAPTLSAASRKGLVYVDLPADPALRPGIFAHGEILLGETPALILPSTAVVWSDGHSYLYEVGQEGIVHRRKVKVGRFEGDRVEIVEGIEPQARVVAAGGAFLHDGDRVRVEAGK